MKIIKWLHALLKESSVKIGENWKEDLRRTWTINDTKIQYLLISDKIYKVTSINWQRLTLEAEETGLRVDDVPESELWDISDLEEFEIRLVNSGVGADVIDMAEWWMEHGCLTVLIMCCVDVYLAYLSFLWLGQDWKVVNFSGLF